VGKRRLNSGAARQPPRRVLTERELNRAVLARQLLLERMKLSLPRTLERIGGIQAQYAPSMYIGLWTRLDQFERDQLTRALERRALAQGTLLRSTIHLVTPRDWWTWSAATRERRREEWLRTRKGVATAKELAAIARKVRARIGDGSIGRKELQELVGKGSKGISAINTWLDLVRVPPSGTWDRRRADEFALAEEWIGPDPRPAKGEATTALVEGYLRGFGPASADEIADWAGLPIGAIRSALGGLELRRFQAEDGAELVDLPRLPLPEADTPAPPRLLGVWDAITLAHARRAQVLPEEHRARVFSTKTPQSINTFMVDGQVAGGWKLEKGKVRLEPFERLDKSAHRALEQEGERLAEFAA
jgi:hypothetical protein